MPKCLSCNSSVISAEVICDRCRGDFVKVVRCRECGFYERVAGVDVCVRKDGLGVGVLPEVDFCSRGVHKCNL